MMKSFAKKFSTSIVKISYTDLVSSFHNHTTDNLYSSIQSAYNHHGLGLLTITDVSNHYEIKKKLLSLAHKLVKLPESSLKKLESPETNYSVGWSHGKESYNGIPDFLKGSFYANLHPLTRFPNLTTNLWSEEIPELEANFLALGNHIREIGLMLLSIIDRYIKSIYPSYNINYQQLVSESKENVGRLLYYYPRNMINKNLYKKDDEILWSGWHNDHSSLTGLTSAIFTENEEECKNLKLKESGLWIQNRQGEKIRVSFSHNEIAFQVGETLQIHSGGLVKATPHCVYVKDDIPENIARTTFALFMGPNVDVKLDVPEGCDFSEIKTEEFYVVPKLQNRFKKGMNFGEFSDATINYFYTDAENKK